MNTESPERTRQQTRRPGENDALLIFVFAAMQFVVSGVEFFSGRPWLGTTFLVAAIVWCIYGWRRHQRDLRDDKQSPR